jgi:hypothetical protein
MFKINQDFTSKIDIYKTFKYEEVSVENFKKFFNTDWEPGSYPMNLDYSKKAINIRKAKEIFDYEMYGSGNGNNN